MSQRSERPSYEDCVHLVTKEELPALFTWLEQHLPQSWKLYATVREILRDKWCGISFYTLGWPDIKAVAEGPGDLDDKFPRKTSIFSPREEDAATLLSLPGFFDWTKPILFMAVAPHLVSLVERFCRVNSLEDDVTRIVPCHAMMAKSGELTSPLPPDDVVIRSLQTKEDIDWGTDNWVYSDEEREDYLADLVKNFPSVVALDKAGNYLGYEVGYEFGAVGMLYVVPGARGQGLGSYITCQLAEKYFQLGLPVVVTVPTNNQASIRLHEKVGFKKMCVVTFMVHKQNKIQKRT